MKQDDTTAPTPSAATSSLARALDILALFTLKQPLLRIEDIMAALGYSRSTAYRYVKELSEAGLLSSLSDAQFSLGPRIIELERQLELTDPLYLAGKQVLPEFRCDDSVLLLHNRYGDKVLCILSVGPEVLEHEGRRIWVGRARGLPFSLFEGAGSLALLAYLPPRQIKQTYLQHSAAIAQAGLGDDWPGFRSNLTRIRRRGHAISLGQITPHLCGVALPILVPGETYAIGSVALAFPLALFDATREQAAVQRLTTLRERLAGAYALRPH